MRTTRTRLISVLVNQTVEPFMDSMQNEGNAEQVMLNGYPGYNDYTNAELVKAYALYNDGAVVKIIARTPNYYKG